MKRTWFRPSSLFPFVLLGSLLWTSWMLVGCSPDRDERNGGASGLADLVFQNGGIYTGTADPEWAESLAVRRKEIVAVGTNEALRGLIGTQTEVVDLAGRMLLPGFHDSHLHPLMGGRSLLGCALHEETTVETLLAKVSDCADSSTVESSEPDRWLEGRDFDLSLFAGGNPQKALLDSVVRERPVILRASDGHNAWANSRALELAGITADTPDPPLGVIERDERGEPSGVLRESAQDLVIALLPEPTEEENREALLAALREANRLGITSFIDSDVGEQDWLLYQSLEAQGELTARVVTSLTYGLFSRYSDDQFDEVLARRDEYQTALLKTSAIKMYVDGVLEGRTAALLEPYEGSHDHYGTLNFSSEELKQAVTRFDALDLQVQMHVIGDQGVREALDAIEAAQNANGRRDNRHHLSHLQLIASDDWDRFGSLGVTANYQALWAYPDRWILELNLPDVGQQRVDRMYPLGSVARGGGRVVGGSDWPVSALNPMPAIETAVRRADATGAVAGVLNEEERLSLHVMLAAYTREGAWLMKQEDQVGTLEVGKRADLVVLERNLFDLELEQIGEVRVSATFLDGRKIYEAER